MTATVHGEEYCAQARIKAAARNALLGHRLILRMSFIHVMQHRTSIKRIPIYSATAIPATARSPAATEPIFFVAAPVKPAAPADPVFDGATGAIGDPVAAAPEPEPEPEPAPEAAPEPFPAIEAPEVPVAARAVPVANPVDPAIPVELAKCQR